MTITNDLLLEVENITKIYGGLTALDNVSFDVRYGEIHALVGENGAGKSTLMKILGAIVKKNSGTVVFNGELAGFHFPLDAIKAGIAIIHQELSMLPSLNVIENIFMGRMTTRYGKIQWRKLESETIRVLSLVGLEINPYTVVKDLSISDRQLIEIAKALSINTKMIIMDEPNSSLSENETEILFSVIRDLKKKGISIIYVSHKIEEVLAISDRISVLRDGKFIGTVNKDMATVDSIIQMMVGRELKRERMNHEVSDEVCLEAVNLSGRGFSNVSFSLKKGEILGFSGLVGAGRSEVARSIFGAEILAAGTLKIHGNDVLFKRPAEAIKFGLAMVPEDRKTLSLFMQNSISFNMSIAELPRLKRFIMIDYKKVDKIISEFIIKLKIKLGSSDHPVSSLSGGNQQKTILARWLATNPDILILDEPTHGVDVGAKSEIYQLIHQLADSGISIILISSELPEILTMSDRVVVMHEGKVTGILEKDELTEENIMAHATASVIINQEGVII